MSNIIFKRLFEVQFLHDYFLTSADGSSFFEKNEAEKREMIRKKLAHNIYDVKNLFEIIPSDTTRQRMSEYRLMMARTALGFIVGVQVTSEIQAGELVYKPDLAMDDSVHLEFSVSPKLPFFEAMSNLSLRYPLPSIHYFSNKDGQEFDEPVVPAYTSLPLSKNVKPHQPGLDYEMGAITDFGGTVREALQFTDGSDATHWEDIDDKRFVTDADKVLLPHNFIFPINPTDGITEVNFVLEDSTTTVIKTINITGVDPLQNVPVNFEFVDETIDDPVPIDSGFYNLKVQKNGGPEVVYAVNLNDDIYDKYTFAVIDIRMDEVPSPFSLLDAGGFLKTRINAANEKVSHPIFEIRFKNRRTYWRYNKEGDFSAADIAATAAHLDHSPEMLISKKPKGLTETLVPFLNGASLVLPHPKIPSIRVENQKMYSEIFINQSNRLLNN